LPDISTINGIDITTLASFGGVAFADGQTLDGQNVALVSDAHTFISSQTASASASLSFTSGIDSTYDVYEFHFINIHPATDSVDFTFQVNAAGQSGFNEVMTTTTFYAYHNEAGSATALTYDGNEDQAQGTGYQKILSYDTGNAADESVSGILTLYAPSSTTYVKQFTSVGNGVAAYEYSINEFVAGYINTTSAIDEIDFKFNSGNIDAGEIRMYGVATS
jgi:FlaG/FlaF family flagellin (archaellin)